MNLQQKISTSIPMSQKRDLKQRDPPREYHS